MPYDSVVCVKQVPDTGNVTAAAISADGTVNRAALPTVFNPEDLNALEVALQIRDRHGGSVTAISMGPPKASDVLRECLYRGADRVVLLTDRLAAGSDTQATSYILSQAIRKLGRFDFVFCGRQAIDGDTGQVGPQCAEKLFIPQITCLEEIVNIEAGTVRARRSLGHGWEVVEAPLPILATVAETANQPRHPAAKRVFRFKRARSPAELLRELGDDAKHVPFGQVLESYFELGLLIEQWSLNDLDADLSRCGLVGSPTRIQRIRSIILGKTEYKELPPTEQGVRQLTDELLADHVLG